MKFSAIYKPTALFSLRDSNSTSSGAKSLFIPSPYCIKMALINQAISLGGEDFYNDKNKFEVIRDLKIDYYINGNFCVNNCFVKIQKQRDNNPFQPTVSFREYIFIDSIIEIIFEVETDNLFDDKNSQIEFLQKYLCRINQFGKRGCFFQFIGYSDMPNKPNVMSFNVHEISQGIIQEFDDFDKSTTFDKINSYSSTTIQRAKKLLVLPLVKQKTSKSYSLYSCIDNINK